MSRRQQRKTGGRRVLRYPFNVHSLIINRHRVQRDALLFNNRTNQRKPGVFHPHTLPARFQRLQYKPHRSRIARGDKHLFGLALYAAGEPEIFHNGLAQQQFAANVPQSQAETGLRA